MIALATLARFILGIALVLGGIRDIRAPQGMTNIGIGVLLIEGAVTGLLGSKG